MQLSDLRTPALLLDAACMERSIERGRAAVKRHGVAFRPHVKTCKSIEVARPMLDAPGGPITVSTLREAEYFLEHGIEDILYAVALTPSKVKDVVRLRRTGARLSVIVESEQAAQAVSAAARAESETLEVLIEIDCDGHRSGVKPDSPDLLAIAEALRRGGQRLAGVMTHAGSSYNCTTQEELEAIAERERALTVLAASRLRSAGFDCPIVSVGSTPTALSARHLEGVTEVRAGVFVFFDLVMAGVGVCSTDEIALSVLASVIGHQPDKGWLIVDAGWMALSRDRGTASQPVDQGYGLVCDASGAILDGLLVSSANQEHGIIAHRSGKPADTPLLPIGTLLRILPNHACATAAQHDRYHVVRGSDDNVQAIWPRFGGW